MHQDPRLQAAVQGLAELDLLRGRQEAVVRAALAAVQQKQPDLDQQISFLHLNDDSSHDHQETDSRPSSGFYELSDPTSASLSTSSHSIFSESPGGDGHFLSTEELITCSDLSGAPPPSDPSIPRIATATEGHAVLRIRSAGGDSAASERLKLECKPEPPRSMETYIYSLLQRRVPITRTSKPRTSINPSNSQKPGSSSLEQSQPAGLRLRPSGSHPAGLAGPHPAERSVSKNRKTAAPCRREKKTHRSRRIQALVTDPPRHHGHRRNQHSSRRRPRGQTGVTEAALDSGEEQKSTCTSNRFGDGESSQEENGATGGRGRRKEHARRWRNRPAENCVKVRASYKLKKKILRFRSGSLKLITTM